MIIQNNLMNQEQYKELFHVNFNQKKAYKI